MSLTTQQLDQAAQDLHAAEVNGTQIGLLSLRHPDMDMDDAYAIQKRLAAHKLNAGRHVIGWKIGLTSKAMQSALNITTPDSGILFDDMAYASGCSIPQDRFIQPRIEAEIAFVMKSALGGENVTRDDVIAATDFVAPSLEILDTRVQRHDPETGKPRVIVDTIADNAANAGIVLGAQQHQINAQDLRWVGAIVTQNNEVVETGLGAGVLNDPIESVVWLARRMHAYDQHIEAGHVILSGSFIRPIECPHGSVVHADFGNFGQVDLRFD